MNQHDIFFLSDVHLGVPVPGFEQREEHFCSFLRSLATRATHLFLGGDIFDFWIEYPRLIRADYFPVLHELGLLVDAGVEVHYLAGNHDFALGPFLRDTVGVVIHDAPFELVLQGKRVYMVHGDGLLKGDVGYVVLRALLRNRVNQSLYKLLHPSAGIALAAALSGLSRILHHRARPPWVARHYRDAARRILASGPDSVVMGHTHIPELFCGNGKTYCNTGEWLRGFSYAKMSAGELSLLRHVPGGEDEPLERHSWNSGKSAS